MIEFLIMMITGIGGFLFMYNYYLTKDKEYLSKGIFLIISSLFFGISFFLIK